MGPDKPCLGLSLERTAVEAASAQVWKTAMISLPEVGRWIILTIGQEEFEYKILRYEIMRESEYIPGQGTRFIQDKIAIVKSPAEDCEDTLDKFTLEDNKWRYIQHTSCKQ